jgi:Uma2 family endonuclease
MTISLNQRSTPIEYPDSDGKPMAESDQTRKYLTYGTEVLSFYFQNRPDVYVSGNLLIYYEEGNTNVSVSPDVFVIFGVEKKDRRSYKTWEEDNKTPDFVLEITSKTTKKEDQLTKPETYKSLGVQEYFQYDPTGDYLKPQLQAARLIASTYQAISPTQLPDGTLSFPSAVLGLELRLQGKELRFYNPVTDEILFTHNESEQARLAAEQAKLAAEERSQRLAEKLRQLNIDPDSL